MKSKIFITLLIMFLVLSCSSEKETTSQKDHIIKHIEIYSSHDEYCAWPAMIRAANGDLLVSFCISEEHLGPNGKIVTVRSTDNGKTWGQPKILLDTPVDDRHAGLTLLRDGRIIAHSSSTHKTRKEYYDLKPNSYEKEVIERWSDYVERPEYATADSLEGSWDIVSSDNGYSWKKPVPGRDSIHGGSQLADGYLLVVSYYGSNGNISVYLTKSIDDIWKKIATVYCPIPDSLRFSEPHILQLPSGRIIMMIRATSKPYNDLDPRCYLWGTYSDDNGKTWAGPYQTPLWGYPPHLLQLSDGRILCTYGYRRPPFGQRACISDDGITWKKENEFILRDDAFNKDLGYPVSVELEPGIVLSVYYQPDPKDGDQRMTPPDPTRHRPDILGMIWRVPMKSGE